MISESPVNLLFFGGCPQVGAARTNLETALAQAGRPLRWQEWDLEDPAAPPWAGGYPSPTVLVARLDVTGQGPSAARGALSCRAEGAPTVAQIVAALSRSEGSAAP